MNAWCCVHHQITFQAWFESDQDQIFKKHPKNFALSFDDIQGVEFGKFTVNITFITRDKKKYSYAPGKKEDYARLKEIFSNYIH